MSKNNSKGLIELKHKKLLNNNQGFSLLELVVTVGVVLVLSLVGLLSYNGITKNARQAAVNNTVDTVYSRAMAYEADTNPDTTYQTALEEYNKTSGSLDNDNTKKSITVEGTRLENNSLRIRAFYTNDESIEAIKITPSSSTTTNNNTGGDGIIITSPSEITSTETILNYRCDEDFPATFPDSLGYPKMILDSEAVVKLTGTDGTNKETTGAGISHTMIAGVEYKIVINGKFQMLTGNKCLRSIEQIGNDSEVKYISYLGANIEEVPNQIPSSVTSMNAMFTGAKNFNQDISGWDVSNVKDMSSMFSNTSSFDRDISGWDVSDVTNMRSMFSGAKVFDNGGLPLDWGDKTAQVTEMDFMFANTSKFNQDISDWNVSNVKNMYYMFQVATAFNQDISDWDVSNVTNMASMFQKAFSFNNGNQPLNWGDKTAQVTDMSGMFYDATVFNQDISGWNVSNVIHMSNMFSDASSFNRDISGWDVSKVTNMSGMFYAATAFNQDISGWDVSKVTSMRAMFSGASSFNQNISGWNVGNVRDMGSMFSNTSSFDQDISGWDVSKVTNMGSMFSVTSKFNQNISGWDVSNVTSMQYMFQNATAFNNGNQSLDWGAKTAKVTSMYGMFQNATAFNQDISGWNVDNVSYYKYFANGSGIAGTHYIPAKFR